jgi:peptide-methionine (S)-S-oxide reductase
MKITSPTSNIDLNSEPIPVAERHYLSGNPLKGPWPEGLLTIVLGKG